MVADADIVLMLYVCVTHVALAKCMRMFEVFNCENGVLKGTHRTAKFSSSPSVPDKLKIVSKFAGKVRTKQRDLVT